jgi:hypothetical protein
MARGDHRSEVLPIETPMDTDSLRASTMIDDKTLRMPFLDQEIEGIVTVRHE